MVEAYATKRGYTVIHAAPDSATRMRHGKLLRFDWGQDGYPGQRTRSDTPLARGVVQAVTDALGEPIIEVPMLGGSLPTYLFAEALRRRSSWCRSRTTTTTSTRRTRTCGCRTCGTASPCSRESRRAWGVRGAPCHDAQDSSAHLIVQHRPHANVTLPRCAHRAHCRHESGWCAASDDSVAHHELRRHRDDDRRHPRGDARRHADLPRARAARTSRASRRTTRTGRRSTRSSSSTRTRWRSADSLDRRFDARRRSSGRCTACR